MSALQKRDPRAEPAVGDIVRGNRTSEWYIDRRVTHVDATSIRYISSAKRIEQSTSHDAWIKWCVASHARVVKAVP